MTTQYYIPKEEISDWTTGLQHCGSYYEGFTDNLQETLNKQSGYRFCRSHTSNLSEVNTENKNPEVRILNYFKKYWLCQIIFSYTLGRCIGS